MTNLTQELMDKSEVRFQVYKTLSANCPKCMAPLVLKYASNPRHGRRLSVIIACSKDCDRVTWNKDVKGQTHWWLDGSRDKEGYERLVDSMSPEDRTMIKKLESELVELNGMLKSIFGF